MNVKRVASAGRIVAAGAALLAGCVESAFAQSHAGTPSSDGGAATPAGSTHMDAGTPGRRGAAHAHDAGRASRSRSGIMSALGALRVLDADAAAGNMFGASAGESFGYGGLGLRGTGSGGGGTGEGTIGIGSLGGRGHGSGYGVGYGSGIGTLAATRPGPTIRAGAVTLEGAGLPSEVVRRVILRNLVALRVCFERAADAGVMSPQLRFVIKPDGAVSDLAADLAVSGAPTDVAQCVTEATRHLRFPSTADGGRVRVTYPLVYNP